MTGQYLFFFPKLWTYPYHGEGRSFVRRRCKSGWYKWTWTPVRRVFWGIWVRNGVSFNLDATGFELL
jgi:hypothetical protein